MSSFQLIKAMWGVTEVVDKLQWEPMLRRTKADGFDGIEAGFGPPGSSTQFAFHSDVPLFQKLLADIGLSLVILIPTCGYPVPADNVDAHIASFKSLCESAAELRPLFINSHSGKDSFSADDAIKFFEAAIEVEEAIGIPIAHETHRQRIFHSPFVYRDLMPRLPAKLKLTADLSHWAVVCERCMDPVNDADFWPAVLADVAKRTIHIHARVGWCASAQVADPEAPEHAKDVAAHFVWWDAIVANMRRRGDNIFAEPEFGPYPYLPHLPHTNVPVVDLWQVCTKFGKRLRLAYGTPEETRSNE